MKSLFFEEYFPIVLAILIAFFLAFIILGLSFIVSISNPDTEKLSSYECGFDPYEDARHNFDVRFYLVAILFIIFDLEAVFFFPWAISLGIVGSWGFWTMIDFIFELVLGFIYAWRIGALEWE